MKKFMLISLPAAALLASGCSSPSSSSTPPASPPPESPAPPQATPTALEGTWKGREITPGHEGQASLKITGQTIDFQGTDPNDWLKATFTVRDDTTPKQWAGVIKECSNSEYIGKRSYAIYRIEGDTLTIAGYEPGYAGFPSSFDAAGTRQFVFKHDQ